MDELTNTPATTGTEEDDVAYGLTRIRCGCGFEVVGANEYYNIEALADHPCPSRPVEYTPWWGFVFSFWTWAIVAVVCYTIIVVNGH